MRQLAVAGLEGDAVGRQAERQGRRPEPFGPAVGHGHAVADGRRAELLPLQEPVEERPVELGAVAGPRAGRRARGGRPSGPGPRAGAGPGPRRGGRGASRSPPRLIRARPGRSGRPCGGRATAQPCAVLAAEQEDLLVLDVELDHGLLERTWA
ncbi:MAG: hypothetical protein MZV64_49695 [Ignavibacteriales bacterium]|nr:hypothetical protein [Ignavibacteriales bacterium]